MHRQLWNVMKLDFKIKPRSPLLVKSGTEPLDPSLPDMYFVRTATSQGEAIYIPGSSLKGVFRSFTEKILRTISKSASCDPLSSSCGKRLEKEEDAVKIYGESCYVCKMYGNTKLKGRIRFSDAYPEGGVKTEVRYGVAISRLTQGVAQGPFEMETVVEGSFKGSLTLENFEAWQVGMIALVIRALNDGVLRVGYGKNRGFGEVEFSVGNVMFRLAKKEKMPEDEVWGVGCYVEDDGYKVTLGKDDKISGLPKPDKVVDAVVFEERLYSPTSWENIAEKSMETLRAFSERITRK